MHRRALLGGFSLASFLTQQTDGVWLDFTNSARLYQGTDEATPITAVNDPIGRVNDRRVGANSPRNATQGTSGARPTFQATGASFDGTDDSLLSTYAPGAGSNFIVAKVAVPASLAALGVVAGARTTTDTRFLVGINSDGRIWGGVGSQSVAQIISDTPRFNQTLAIGITQDGSQVRLFDADKIGYSGAQAGSITTTTPLRIGALNDNGSVLFPTQAGVIIASVVVGREFIDLPRFLQIASQL